MNKDRDPRSARLTKSFLRFAKRGARNLKIADSKQTDQPVEDAPDKNISLPWNFQHNIHIDESFGGLPPSWFTSLMKACFLTAEIDTIRSHRVKLHTHPTYSLIPLSNLCPSPLVYPSLPSLDASRTHSYANSSADTRSRSPAASRSTLTLISDKGRDPPLAGLAKSFIRFAKRGAKDPNTPDLK